MGQIARHLQKIFSRVVLGVVLAMAFYLGLTLWADAAKVWAALGGYAWWTLAAAVLLAAANYLIRFARWQFYLRSLGLEVPRGESLLIFLAGFSLTVTPGKLGEAVKSLLLRQARQIPVARTAPIVIAERLTDLMGLLLLAGIGAFSFPIDRRLLVAAAALVALGLAMITVDPLARRLLALAVRLPVLHRFADKLREGHDAAVTLLRPAPLLLGVALSVMAWWLECLAFYLVVNGFTGASIGLHPATFIYAAMTVAGALSFLPGGLGVTEAGMLFMLTTLGTGLTRGTAAAATFITRVATLWFAVMVGLAALTLFTRRKHLVVELPDKR